MSGERPDGRQRQPADVESHSHSVAEALAGPGAGSSRPDATDVSIVTAARVEFVRYGIRRANVEQIARRAGISRVTVYRRFANKGELLRAVILADIADIADRFDAAWDSVPTAEEKIVEAVALCVREIRNYPLLQTVMRSEPEQMLTELTTQGQNTFEIYRTLMAARIDQLVDAGQLAPHDTARASEVMLRLGYSVALFPYGLVPGETDEEVRSFARDVIVPLFQR